MEFRRAISRVDGVLMVVAVVGCIHALFLTPMNCYGSDGQAISLSDRMYLESLPLQGTLTFHNTTAFALDWGQLRTRLPPSVVVHPSSVHDIATVVAAVAKSESQLTVAARGLGSSIFGQAQVIPPLAMISTPTHAIPTTTSTRSVVDMMEVWCRRRMGS